MRASTWFKFPAALWWGSLTTLGFFVVPMLFGHLPNKALAGNMAARLFEVQTWLSLACALVLLLALRLQQRKTSEAANIEEEYTENHPVTSINTDYSAIIFIAFGMLMAFLVQFGVSPRIVARDNLMLWHTLGSLMYLAQWICAGVVLYKVR